jgi:uncharacterized protein YlxW (UPF0749 family)
VKLKIHWSLALIGIITGILFSLQYRITEDIEKTEAVRKTTELSNQLVQLKDERDALQDYVSKMRKQLEILSTNEPQFAEKMRYASVLAGFNELTGQGVEVTLSDSVRIMVPGDNPNLYLVHDEDILRVVNELKAAGAEAISINGQRMIAGSEIICSGPTIRVNRRLLSAPFVIKAIGSPEGMENSLKMRGGVLETLQFYGLQITVKKLSKVTIPAFAGNAGFDYAKQAEI